jgi:dTDP-4-amino-4,6-dideoxygalactose transaminase
MTFDTLFEFEELLAEYTGAPYVVVTDGCTHALELCFRLDRITYTEFTAFTYLSIPQLMHKLNISYELKTEYWNWAGEYQFANTNIWDSARLLKPAMYRAGQKQCLSFGHGKSLELGKGGAILLDSEWQYQELSRMRSDGRDLRVRPWQDQQTFGEGYHYCPTLETCRLGIEKLPTVDIKPKYYQYPDLRTLDFQC